MFLPKVIVLDQSIFVKNIAQQNFIAIRIQFLESRVVDTEEETYVEVTELRMADV